MAPTTLQWCVRWGCLVLIALGTLMQIVSMACPFWIQDQARPPAYPAFLQLLKQAGVDPVVNASRHTPGAENEGNIIIRRAGADVGLWRWCVELEVAIDGGQPGTYRACHSPAMSDFPGWWRGCQAMAIVGILMGMLACFCAVLELQYTRHGVRFSGLVVLCSICCFVAALGMGLSHGMFASKYTEKLLSILHLPIHPGGGMFSMYPPVLGWSFGVGAAGATLIGVTGIVLLAVITRTYPTYQRTENVVV